MTDWIKQNKLKILVGLIIIVALLVNAFLSFENYTKLRVLIFLTSMFGFLAFFFGVLLTVSFTKGQRERYPGLKCLDGKQLHLFLGVIICSLLAYGTNAYKEILNTNFLSQEVAPEKLELNVEVPNKKVIFDFYVQKTHSKTEVLRSDNLLEFNIENVGSLFAGKPAGSLDIHYNRIGQSKNECNIDTYFFNDTAPVCYFDYKCGDTEKNEVCKVSVDRTLKPGDYCKITAYFKKENERFQEILTQYNLTETCEIEEIIMLRVRESYTGKEIRKEIPITVVYRP